MELGKHFMAVFLASNIHPYIHSYTLFDLEFRVAKDKLVSSSYKYDPKYF